MWTVPVPLMPPPKFSKFANRLRGARKDFVISIDQMAHKLGITVKQYTLFEKGYEFPDDNILSKINNILFGYNLHGGLKHDWL